MESSWHRDDGSSVKSFNKNYFEVNDINDENLKCSRIAIYLQDHDNSFPGLYVKPRSHIRGQDKKLSSTCLKLKSGDVIIFDVRLIHSGTFRNKFFSNLILKIEGNFKKYITFIYLLIRKIILYFRKDKLSVFLVYGVDNKFTRIYEKYA